ncbi:outer membrane lipoprotein-sorting protein [Paenibacillus terrae HPL-003]|uniref:Outer membrane lipoprotein-sorting protein n=1 Tax=Paenibacillus terrae (strain HPL-003) TaxID=985665 RepID=G7W258_PAETH|nr:outer membrane lipoprotein carrier protein LolA [Paenibacillus terrae]AET59642.1 outer membrane lipoprotein-sorting protein [Paenibacillus terrae HPL-003]
MRRISWMLAMVMCVTLLLAGCGKKSADDVVKDLSDVVSDLNSYHGTALMTLHTGDTPQEYKVDISYRKPSYYRIAMTNEKKDVTQIVLRNDEGVFVLTPSLNKSFRFKSDWPNNQGQVYLYETLVRSIIGDASRQLASDDKSYVFDVAANYNSHALVRQKIWLSKNNYAPTQVQVSDANAKVVVDLKFDQFAFDTKFDKDSFDMERNMASGKTGKASEGAPSAGAVDSSGQPDSSGTIDGMTGVTSSTDTEAKPDTAGNTEAQQQTPSTSDAATGASAGTDAAEAVMGEFGLIEPSYTPAGVQIKDTPELEDNGTHAVMLRYSGMYNYTIVEARPKDRAVSLAAGELVDIGGSFAVLAGSEQQTMTWMNDGIEFRITSADLPVSEMIQIAASIQDQSGK